MRFALFDFGGIITTDDSLIKFIRFVVGDAKFIWGMTLLTAMLTAYKLKRIPNYKANESKNCTISMITSTSMPMVTVEEINSF